ncbi:MAG TPA: hypothetical protein DCW47_05200 [Lachnospiraceae bacterium]|nr:hypothetical protein [Lachnospiraceae bacterium]
MPKKTVSNNTKKRKRKLRLKKSARRTIAALMLVTAIIVAAVPVRSVSATDTDGRWDHSEWLNIEKIMNDETTLANHVRPDAGHSGSDTFEAFACDYVGDQVITEEFYDKSGKKHSFVKINEEGYDSEYIFPIYDIRIIDAEGGKGAAINLFKGDKAGYSIPKDEDGYTVTLKRKVCYGGDFTSAESYPDNKDEEGYWIKYKYINALKAEPVDAAMFAQSSTNNTDQKLNVIFDLRGGGDPFAREVDKGAILERPADPVWEGHTFRGWYEDPNALGEAYSFNTQVNNGFTLYAGWDGDGESPEEAGDTCTVTFDLQYDGKTFSQTVNTGGNAERPEDPSRDGYSFEGWYADPALSGDPYDFGQAVSGSITLFAKWAQGTASGTSEPGSTGSESTGSEGSGSAEDENTFTVTFDPQNGSAPKQVSVAYGEYAPRPSDPMRDGHAFIGWYRDPDGSGAGFDFNTAITEDIIVYAVWDSGNTGSLLKQADTITAWIPEKPLDNGVAKASGDVVTKTWQINQLSEEPSEGEETPEEQYENGDIGGAEAFEEQPVFNEPDDQLIERSASEGEYVELWRIMYRYDNKEATQSEAADDTTEGPGHWVQDDEGRQNLGSFCTESYEVYEIDSDAFAGRVSNVEKIVLPQNVRGIGDNAFKGCGFKEITIGNQCKYIGAGAFSECSALTTADLSNAGFLEKIGDCAFAGDYAIKQVLIPPLDRWAITDIGCGAFMGCEELQSVPIHENMGSKEITIGSYAFANCNKIEKVNWSALNIKGLKEAHGLFTSDSVDGSNLLSVHFPKTFNDPIAGDNFEGCYKLVYLRFHGNGTVDYNGPKYEFVSLSNLRQYIEYLGLSEEDVEGLNLFTVDECFYIWGPNYKSAPEAFKYARQNGNTYRFDDTDDSSTNQNYTINSNGYSMIADVNTGEITEVIDIEDSAGASVLAIPGAKIKNEQYEEIAIDSIADGFSQSLARVGDDNRNCLGLVEKVEILPEIKRVGKNAFSGIYEDDKWSGLPNLSELYVEIDDDGLSLGQNAFENCTGLETVDFSPLSPDDSDDTGLSVGDSCFLGCESLELVSFRDYKLESESSDKEYNVNVTNIGKDAFYTRRDGYIDDTGLIAKYGGESMLYVRGKVDDQSYLPFRYSLVDPNLSSGGKYGLGFITYVSGNPENISLKYFGDLKSASLVTYPTAGTVIDDDYHTISDLLDKSAEDLTDAEGEILEYFRDMDIPDTITTIEKAYNMSSKDAGGSNHKYVTFVNKEEGIDVTDGLQTLTINNVAKLPVSVYDEETMGAGVDAEDANTSLSNNRKLSIVTFNNNVTSLGSLPFLNDVALQKVDFLGEGSREGEEENIEGGEALNDQDSAMLSFDADASDPYYWEKNGIIYSDDGTNITLEEVLPSRGIQYGTGYDSKNSVNSKLDPDLLSVTRIATGAFQNCDEIYEVDFTDCKNFSIIPDYCFYDCDNLKMVKLGSHTTKVGSKAFARTRAITIEDYSKNTQYQSDSFDYDTATIYGYTGSTAEQYVKDYVGKHNETVTFIPFNNSITVYFKDGGEILDMSVKAVPGQTLYSTDFPSWLFPYTKTGYTFLGWLEAESGNFFMVDGYFRIPEEYSHNTITFDAQWDQVVTTKVTVTFGDQFGLNYIIQVDKGTRITEGTIPLDVKNTVNLQTGKRKKYTFKDWTPPIPYPEDEEEGLTENITFYANYDKKPSKKTSSSGGGSTGGGSTGTSSTGSSSRSSSSSSSSSSRSSSMSSSSATNSSTVPVVVSGAVSGYTPVGNVGNISSGGGNTGGGSQRGSGNTNVVSNTPGISDVSKMSATVNGSSDNYVLKFTETQEANEMAVQALTKEYGSLDNIRYLPMDISLYDSSGNNRISPIPEGTSVSVTTPIPDDLAIYGGNAKVACTQGGVLEKLDPRFTVINGVPCMNFTCTHLTPYVIYVDTANLSDSTVLDSTPKTGDMIHPKWFLVIGLIAGSIFLFLKKDRGERVVPA